MRVGIRLGVVTNHDLFQGAADRHGKYGNGHMVVNTNGRRCVCGSDGCVHTYSTILALKSEVIEKIKCGHSSLLMEHVENPEDIDFDSICLAVEKDDALCTTILKDFGYHTGIAVSNIFALLQPDLVILGGPMYHRFDLF
ncbi:ROK family protein [Virgibacillus alimentarius]|uniref:NBD/HSP70 family sugar kinase n=1 Tax=Virgibacillus alimentarius TaxID=698769 RepID=A0ABS4S9N2_9BACI|nr:ROK family protein [Virgibacillus alimentarius]MBP2258218.1 putative NBD/HSP70 family sugar kinase [Virgibacillus alimentarius]